MLEFCDIDHGLLKSILFWDKHDNMHCRKNPSHLLFESKGNKN